MIDLTKPIEAVHTDGWHAPARVDMLGGSRVVHIERFGSNWYASANGEIGGGWTIRNAPPAWRTAPEQLDRMDALVRKLADRGNIGRTIDSYLVTEANAILVARKPVDPRFTKICDAIRNSWPHLADATLSRMARDVLAALDA